MELQGFQNSKISPEKFVKCFGLVTSFTVFFRMKSYMCNKMRKSDQFLQEKNYKRGILFVLMKVNFVHIKSCAKKTQEYVLSGAGSYILEFKFQEK